MNPLEQHHYGNIFYITAISWAIAQGLKVLIYYIRHHKINFRLFIGMGGMPSSHSAFVCSLATIIGLDTHWDSAGFLARGGGGPDRHDRRGGGPPGGGPTGDDFEPDVG